MGLTLLAAGTSVPDTVASVLVARKGKDFSIPAHSKGLTKQFQSTFPEIHGVASKFLLQILELKFTTNK